MTGLWPAKVATAPAAGRVAVLVPDFDAEQPYEACPYTPRGTAHPSVGDECWVAFDPTGQAVVVTWLPS